MERDYDQEDDTYELMDDNEESGINRELTTGGVDGFNMDNLAPQLQSTSSGIQQYELNPLRARQYDFTSTDAFNAQGVRQLPLSKLKRCFDRKDSSKAISYLSSKSTLVVDGDLVDKAYGVGYRLNMDSSFIDYLCKVPSRSGSFAAALPGSRFSNMRYMLELDLSNRIRQWPSSRCAIGFDTDGRFLWIGRAEDENIFLALTPPEYFDAGVTSPLSKKACHTSMPPPLYRKIVAFFAFALFQDGAHNDWGIISESACYDVSPDGPHPSWASMADRM